VASIMFYLTVLARAWREGLFAARFKLSTGDPDALARALGASALILLFFVWLPVSIIASPAVSRAKAHASALSCEYNLPIIGFPFDMWSIDHGARYPFNVSTNEGGTHELRVPDASGFELEPVDHFRAVANYLKIPRVLCCPGDKRKTAATKF